MKKSIIKTILMLVVLSFLCIYIYDNFKVEVKTTINIKEKESCSKEIKEYYKDKLKNNYYLYCLDDVIIDYGDRTLELNKSLDVKQIDMEFIISNLKLEYALNNDLIKYYKNNEFSLLVCEKENYKNYFFGKKDMQYNEGLCNDYPYIETLKEKYLVIDVSESKKTDLIYVTIKDSVTLESATVLIDSIYRDLLMENNYYIFSFYKTTDINDNTINDIFTNNKLINVEKISQ